jgi:hypothetical protein
MSKEILDGQKIETGENQENEAEKSLGQVMENLSERNNLEGDRSEEIQEKVSESDSAFQKEIEQSGILNKLGEKIKKNKLVRAGIIGLSLCNASPSFALELNKALDKVKMIDSIPLSQEKEILNLNQLDHLSESRKQEVENILASSPDRVKKIILDELGNESNKEVEKSLGEDLPVLQQRIVDLKNSGEIDSNKQGGVILPFDENHSGESGGVENIKDPLMEKNREKQQVNLENVNEEQIRNWVNFLKDPEKYKERKAEWNEKNEQGWQSSDSKKEDSISSQEKDEKNSPGIAFEKERDGQ